MITALQSLRMKPEVEEDRNQQKGETAAPDSRFGLKATAIPQLSQLGFDLRRATAT